MKIIRITREIKLLVTFGVLAILVRALWLTALPVFADEAIYIRWAQLILDEPMRYAFFALNDGKTPLFIWLLVFFQKIISDPLWAGRIVTVLSSPFQIWLMWLIAKKYQLNRTQTVFVLLLSALLPIWHFHARLALMDAWLTVFLTACWWLILRFEKMRWAGLWVGLSLGLSLWTKLSAILFLPGLFLAGLSLTHKGQRADYIKQTALAGTFGAGLFLLLKLNPAFHQLFSRGSDFLFSFEDLIRGEWLQVPARLISLAGVLATYLSPLVLLTPILGLRSQLRRVHLAHLAMILPGLVGLAVLGKVVYPRYLLPLAPALTLSAGIILGTLWTRVSRMRLSLWQGLASIGLTTILASILVPALTFILSSWWWPAQLQLPRSDQVQYLTEWSAGDGIHEIFRLIQTQSQKQTIAVATEGFFGTLPDGLLMYLHSEPLQGVWIEGIGQPVSEIPERFKLVAREYDQQWLVVNSHRNQLNLDSQHRLAQYCRITGAPCLELWDISSLIQ